MFGGSTQVLYDTPDRSTPPHPEQLAGLTHVVFWMSGAIPRSSEVLEAIGDFLRERLK